MNVLIDTFFPLSEEVSYLPDGKTMKIALEYFFDITQEEAQNEIKALLEQFAMLDDAIGETLELVLYKYVYFIGYSLIK